MSKITHCLWFDGKAEEAATFYVSLLPDSRIDSIAHSPMDWPGGKAGGVITVEFTLAGQSYLGLNGGPHYRPNPAISLSVACEDQAEVDRLWEALERDGGQPVQCGWITDRYGFSWQIVPKALTAMMKDKDPARVGRVMAAFIPMVKFDLATIEKAYDGA